MKVKLITAMIASLMAGSASAGLVDLSQYSKVHYVSSTGSDTNTGSKSNPFATVQQAILAAGLTGEAIYVDEGTYDITNTGATTFGNSGLNNNGKSVDFIGVNGKTILSIDGTATSERDLHFYSGKGFSRIYGMTFLRDSNNRYQNYQNAIFGYGEVKGEFYNTVFKSFNTGAMGMTYANGGGINVKVFNSVFDLDRDFTTSYSGTTANMVIQDSVSNKAFRLYDGATQFNNVVSNVTFDANYNITSPGVDNSLVGINSGTYSWQAADVSAPWALGLFSFAGLLLARRKKPTPATSA